MTRGPRVVDRGPAPGAPVKAAPPGAAGPPPPGHPARADGAPGKERGWTSGPVVFTAFVAATFVAVAYGPAPVVAGSGLLGGVIVWAVMLAGLTGLMELVRHWWRRPNRDRWRGAAWAGRHGGRGVKAGAVYAGRGVAWGYRRAAVRARGRPAPAEPAEPGPEVAAAAPARPEPAPLPELAWPDPVYLAGPPAGPGAGRPAVGTRPVGRGEVTGPIPAIPPGPPPATVKITSAHGYTTPGWERLIGETGDFVAGDDEEWLEWTRAQVIGQGRYAQAILDAYEAQVYETGVDPNALQGMILFGEAAADAAETMADARRWFVNYMAEYREAALAGKHPPRDPHWVTGHGDDS
jgi:hypothetical protein